MIEEIRISSTLRRLVLQNGFLPRFSTNITLIRILESIIKIHRLNSRFYLFILLAFCLFNLFTLYLIVLAMTFVKIASIVVKLYDDKRWSINNGTISLQVKDKTNIKRQDRLKTRLVSKDKIIIIYDYDEDKGLKI